MDHDELDLDEFAACLQQVRAGDIYAVAKLYDDYFSRSVEFLRAQLRDGEQRVIDEEAAAISALVSIVHRVRDGAYEEVKDQLSFWRLLAKVLSCKLHNYRRRMYGPKRSPQSPILPMDQVDGDSSHKLPRAMVTDQGPSPVSQLIASETLDRLLDHLGDSGSKEVLLLRMQGFSEFEVADQLGHSRSWVQRRMNTIRRIANSLLKEDD